MKYRQLGSTGVSVSEIGFGGWTAGGAMQVTGGVPIGFAGVSDDEVLAALRHSRTEGVNFYDTADIYGHGRSESLIGLTTRKDRENVVIATKVGLVRGATEKIEKNFTKRHILHAIDGSLHRLRTDYVDLYQLHNPSLSILEQGEAQEAMEMLQTSGKIRYWGVSAMSVEDGIEIMRRGWGYTLQILFNILNQRAADELLPLAKKNRYGIIVRVPLASGLLSGRYRTSTTFPPKDVRQNFLTPRRLAEALPRVDEVKSIVGPSSETLIEAALRFILAWDEVSTVIPGARNTHQVEQNASASGAPLPPDVVRKLRERLGEYNFYERHAILI